MADTALKIITRSLLRLKLYAPGVQINAADSSLALDILNEMLDEWSNETLICFANLEQNFTLVPGVNSYTIGPGGTISGVRPISVSTAPGTVYLLDANNNRYPLAVIEQDQWNMLGLLTNTSNLPDTLFYNPQYPLGIINIFPTPNIAYKVYFDSRLQLADISNLNTAFSLPPGYMSAISRNLSVRLWPFFKQGDPSPMLIEEAAKSLGTIKRTNLKQSPATYDTAIVSKASSTYNIYSDTSGQRGN
jgi:hypothetical protein